MDHAARERLFQDLIGLSALTEDKPMLSENLTDILEILAVAEGTKPAHLNGQGFRSEWLQDRLQSTASRHGLLSVRKPKISNFQYRPAAYWPEVAVWLREQDDARQAAEGDVIWIFRESAIAPVIADTVAGRISCSRALGYPECCVKSEFERTMCISEGLVNGLRKKFKVDTADEVIALLKRDEAVTLDTDSIRHEMKRSTTRFPYVQFFACVDCLDTADSPAARVNRAMRDLAFEVSSLFGADIWRAARDKSGTGTNVTVSRNDTCRAEVAESLRSVVALSCRSPYRLAKPNRQQHQSLRNTPCYV